jgi:hypothetical protein
MTCTVVEEHLAGEVTRSSWRQQRTRTGCCSPSTAGSVTCGATRQAAMPGSSSSFDPLLKTRAASSPGRAPHENPRARRTPRLRRRRRAAADKDPATRTRRSLVIPDDAIDRIRRWADRRVPEHARDQVRLEVDVTDRTVTILECRPPWRPEHGPDWARFPIARLRYTTSRKAVGRGTGETGT